MADLKLDAQAAATYITEFNNQQEEYSTTLENIATIFTTLATGTIWTGALKNNYINQVTEFLPNLKLGYNIIEKTKKDLNSCITNDIITDER